MSTKNKKPKQIEISLNRKTIEKVSFWVLIVLLLVTSGFLVNYIIQGVGLLNDNEDSQIAIENQNGEVLVEDNEDDENGDIIEDGGLSDERTPEELRREIIENTQAAENISAAQWVANNYEPGDIDESPYVVKSGDTLWEIAEAFYGDGGQWTQILDLNSTDIDFLPNGQQALIYPGQVLQLE